MPCDELDPRKYKKIANEVRQFIANDEPAPSITALTAMHKCARGTAARALQELAAEGLLTRYPGKGYIAAPKAAG